jgi:hypothetical protein
VEFSLLGKVRKTRHRFAVNGRKIFHREAGGDTSPALLHGRRPTCSATSSRLCQATTMWWPRLTGLRVLRGTGPGAVQVSISSPTSSTDSLPWLNSAAT